MVIDTHIHPALFAPICEDQERFRRRCDAMNYHLMKPSDMALLRKQYALADIGRVVLLPEDCSVESGMVEISNDEIAKLVALDAQFYIGMAAVDPRRPDAVQELERAFAELGLAGLAVNTARLKMYPTDERLVPLYDLCRKYHKPIIFHAGFCLENNALAKYARPMEFEEVALRWPEVNLCLAHFGWPWVQETAALLLKYPNLYANTALMNFDGPYQLFPKVFKQDMGEYWLDHNLADKVMFGSDSPRIRPVRSKRDEGKDLLEKCNALFWMGGPEQMRFELKEVSICAEKEFELIRITDPVREFVAQTGVKNGVVYVITEHTTTGIMVNESLPCVEKDIMETLDRIAPEDYPYHHNHYLPTYGTIGGNAPGHLKSLLTGNHCVFPIAEGKIKLGSAADIYFCEYDGIKNRKYMIYVMGE